MTDYLEPEETGVPHITCYGPLDVTRESLVAALVDQNAICPNCDNPFDDSDYCAWPGGSSRVEHVHCDYPQWPTKEQRLEAYQRIRKVSQ